VYTVYCLGYKHSRTTFISIAKPFNNFGQHFLQQQQQQYQQKIPINNGNRSVPVEGCTNWQCI
jgi:hypothetical protein